MPRLTTQVPPPIADEAKRRGRCAIATFWPPPDLHDMLDVATESPATGSATSGPATDDLLSQLAGKEIDRLLADAGVEPTADTPASSAAAPAEPSAPAPADSAISSPAVSAAIEPPATSATSADTAASEPPAATAAGAALVEQELDQIVAQQLSEAVMGQLDAEKLTGVTSAAATSPVTAETPAPQSAVPDLLDRLEAGERSPAPAATPAALPEEKSKAPAPAVAAPEAPAAATSGADDPDEISLPESSSTEPALIGRVLDWVTLPLDPFPAPIRDVIGKIAIVTTINAAAVLAYVTFFRK